MAQEDAYELLKSFSHLPDPGVIHRLGLVNSGPLLSGLGRGLKLRIGAPKVSF